jgi:CheY-like chemotaxis protein
MRKKTILIVEDDASHRDVLRDILEDAGFSVLAVEDGLAALSQLSHGVDLVLLDLVMPRAQVDGFVFLSEVRSRPDLANTPVMILSGLGSAVMEAMDPAIAEKLRIVSVVAKPVVITELVRQVREILEPGAAPGSPP